MRRVVVTGMGVVSPVGNSVAEVWNAMIEGKSGVGPITYFPTDDLAIKIAGEVRNINPADVELNDKVAAKRMDRSSIFAVLAAKEALKDAGIVPRELGDRCGVVLGSGLAGLATMEEQTQQLLSRGPRGVSVFTIPMIMPNGPPANVSLAFDIYGPCSNAASACASSGHATITSLEAIRRGQVDVMVTGGTESPILRLSIAAFSNMKAMTKKFNDDPTRASRPFDAGRDGFVLAEGSTILILEAEEHARARGAKIYAEIIGYGDTADSHHLVAPEEAATGAARALRNAFAMAQLAPEKVAEDLYVNAHGTSTKLNDAAESAALMAVFGKSAEKLRISSTKSMTGHLIGAAGAIESLASVMALREGILPPTINYETPDPDCPLDYIPNQARQAKVTYALNNSFGFGGHNTTILFRQAS